jgi:WD40 repeat protein
VSGSDDNTVCIWDAISGDQLKQMDDHTNYILSVTFSFDGAKVVSGSADYTVCDWDGETGEQLQQIKGHADWVWAVAFSSDGSKIVLGSSDKTVSIWDAATGEQLKVMDGHTDWVYSVAFSPDGSKVCQVQGIKLFTYGMQLLFHSIRERLARLTTVFLLPLPQIMQLISYQKLGINLVMEFMLNLTSAFLPFPPLPQ